MNEMLRHTEESFKMCTGMLKKYDILREDEVKEVDQMDVEELLELSKARSGRGYTLRRGPSLMDLGEIDDELVSDMFKHTNVANSHAVHTAGTILDGEEEAADAEHQKAGLATRKHIEGRYVDMLVPKAAPASDGGQVPSPEDGSSSDKTEPDQEQGVLDYAADQAVIEATRRRSSGHMLQSAFAEFEQAVGDFEGSDSISEAIHMVEHVQELEVHGWVKGEKVGSDVVGPRLIGEVIKVWHEEEERFENYQVMTHVNGSTYTAADATGDEIELSLRDLIWMVKPASARQHQTLAQQKSRHYHAEGGHEPGSTSPFSMVSPMARGGGGGGRVSPQTRVAHVGPAEVEWVPETFLQGRLLQDRVIQVFRKEASRYVTGIVERHIGLSQYTVKYSLEAEALSHAENLATAFWRLQTRGRWVDDVHDALKDPQEMVGRHVKVFEHGFGAVGQITEHCGGHTFMVTYNFREVAQENLRAKICKLWQGADTTAHDDAAAAAATAVAAALASMGMGGPNEQPWV